MNARQQQDIDRDRFEFDRLRRMTGSERLSTRIRLGISTTEEDRLADAAAEMFEALKSMDAAIEGYHLSGWHDMNDLARCEARQKMRNAIAKVQL